MVQVWPVQSTEKVTLIESMHLIRPSTSPATYARFKEMLARYMASQKAFLTDGAVRTKSTLSRIAKVHQPSDTCNTYSQSTTLRYQVNIRSTKAPGSPLSHV